MLLQGLKRVRAFFLKRKMEEVGVLSQDKTVDDIHNLQVRDEEWLLSRFEQIWQLFFPEVEKKNVYVRWKGKWKNKFGHITRTRKGTEIAVNSLFRDIRVPEFVVKLTIAHEIVHYMHGFHSHLPKQFKHPHHGGIVNKVLREKGFWYDIKKEKQWARKEWIELYRELCPEKVGRRVSTRGDGFWDFFRF